MGWRVGILDDPSAIIWSMLNGPAKVGRAHHKSTIPWLGLVSERVRPNGPTSVLRSVVNLWILHRRPWLPRPSGGRDSGDEDHTAPSPGAHGILLLPVHTTLDQSPGCELSWGAGRGARPALPWRFMECAAAASSLIEN